MCVGYGIRLAECLDYIAKNGTFHNLYDGQVQVLRVRGSLLPLHPGVADIMVDAGWICTEGDTGINTSAELGVTWFSTAKW